MFGDVRECAHMCIADAYAGDETNPIAATSPEPFYEIESVNGPAT
jgi:hypothetical protein